VSRQSESFQVRHGLTSDIRQTHADMLTRRQTCQEKQARVQCAVHLGVVAETIPTSYIPTSCSSYPLYHCSLPHMCTHIQIHTQTLTHTCTRIQTQTQTQKQTRGKNACNHCQTVCVNKTECLCVNNTLFLQMSRYELFCICIYLYILWMRIYV